MGLESVAAICRGALLLWLGAMAALVAYRCLAGRIRLEGMLQHRHSITGDWHFSPERAQLLVMFLFALVAYATLGLRAIGKSSLPEVPPELLVPLAGSHAIYLSGKAGRILLQNREGDE